MGPGQSITTKKGLSCQYKLLQTILLKLGGNFETFFMIGHWHGSIAQEVGLHGPS